MNYELQASGQLLCRKIKELVNVNAYNNIWMLYMYVHEPVVKF